MSIRWMAFVALLVLLVGCGTPTTEEGAGDATLGETAQGFVENQLADIEQAVEANDMEAARTAFSEFQEAYQDVQAEIEAAAPEVGERISASVRNLESELNAETPDVAAINEELGRLRQDLESLATEE